MESEKTASFSHRTVLVNGCAPRDAIRSGCSESEMTSGSMVEIGGGAALVIGWHTEGDGTGAKRNVYVMQFQPG